MKKTRVFLTVLAALILAPVADAQPLRKAAARAHAVVANAAAVTRHVAHQAVVGVAAVCTGQSCTAPAAQFVPVPSVAPLPMAGPGNSSKPLVVGAATPQVVGDRRFTPLKTKIAKTRAKIIDGLIAQGVDPTDAKMVVGQIGDGQILKYLIEHFDDILAIVLKLLPLFLDDGRLSLAFVGYIGPPVTWIGVVRTSGCPPGFTLAA